MARTLIIKNADFSVNKLTTVELEEEVPCTAIELSKSTSSLTQIGGTDTITATVTPADTTDAVVWSTSDANVATVAGGVITATGCGTATITATCGNYSDTCSVTVVHVENFTYDLNTYLTINSTHDYMNGGELANYAIGYSTTGSYKLYLAGNGKYPIKIPNGATKIEITSSDFKPYGFWTKSNQSSSEASGLAKAYPKDDFGSQASSYGNRSVTIPNRETGDYAGMDSVAFVFKYNGTISDSVMKNVVVTFTA